MKQPELYDYRDLTLKNMTEPRFRHLFLILYWPLYLLWFAWLQANMAGEYHVMHSALDDLIPFSEYFIVPYLFWFIYWTGMLFYCLYFEVPTFKRTMKFLILTLTFSLITYVIYPTSQELRPEAFASENVFTHLVQWIYDLDPSCNVCPSMHVIMAVGTAFAAYDAETFSPWQKRLMAFLAILISISTVFVKQHSVIDVMVAIPVCMVGYWLCFRKKDKDVSSAG